MIKKLTLFFVLISVIAVGYVGQLLNRALPIAEQGRVVQIHKGDSLYGLAYGWQKEGLLPSARLFLLQARFMKLERSIRPGEFLLQQGSTSADLLKLLAEGKAITHRIALIEGRTLYEELQKLAAQGKLKQDIEPLTSEKVAQVLSVEKNPEGLIYPDTYVYHSGDSVSGLLKQGAERMDQILQQEWQAYLQRVEKGEQQKLPYENAYEALVMASIVEKETGQVSERPQIAGVFVRRLQKNMRLETDPTVIYGLGSSFDGDLKRKHLRDRSNPYNTYRMKGLPPTPIAFAGREAINAALNPADGEELYFVAKGDGSHYFSKTLKEHNNAVNRYQRFKRTKNYRSAPEGK